MYNAVSNSYPEAIRLQVIFKDWHPGLSSAKYGSFYGSFSFNIFICFFSIIIYTLGYRSLSHFVYLQ